MKRIFTILLVLLAVIGAAFYWFILDGRLTQKETYLIDINAVRQLANSLVGEKPTEIQVEKVAQFRFLETLSLAGSGFDVVPMGVYSFNVITPNGNVVIDTGYDQVMAQSARADFFPEPYARMQAAINRANLIMVTHEHYDHIGGLVQHPNVADILPNILLTKEQIAASAEIRPRFEPPLPDEFVPLEFEEITAVSPGIVLIKAPGHTPGSIMVFVQLQNGQEYLFVGDIAWHDESIQQPTLRPRFISDIFLPEEDRDSLSAQLRFLNKLSQTEPYLIQVAGHDNAQIEALFDQGLLVDGFGE